MSGMAHIVLRKAARLVSNGETEKAGQRLTVAIDSGLSDVRLQIRRAIASGDYKSLKETLDQGDHKSGAGWFFLALDAFRNGDMSGCRLFCGKGIAISPRNLSISALLAVADLVEGDKEPLISFSNLIHHTSIHTQALALMAVEKSILSRRLSDTGAIEGEDQLGGPAGWIMDRLDDIAVFAYWLIWKTLNIIRNIADSKRRAVKSNVLDGDLLEGYRKKNLSVRYYLKALELDSENQEALESMVIKSIENEAFDDALKFLSRLDQSLGQDHDPIPHLIKWEADILFMMMRFSEAEPLYQKAVKLFPLEYMVFYRLGLCRLRLGDEAGAEDFFKKSLGLINHGLIAQRLEFLRGPH